MATSWESFDQMFDNENQRERAPKRQKVNFELRSLPHDVQEESVPEILEEELGYYRVELMGCIPPMGEGKEMFDHECNDCKYKWWIEDTDEDDVYL